VRAFALSLLAVALAAAPARAHQSSVKYVDVTIDGEAATVRFTVAPGDVTEALGLAADALPAVDAAAVPAAAAYVAGWLAISTIRGTACARGDASAAPDPDHRFVVVAWTATCPVEIERLRYDFTAFFAVDPRHEVILTIHAPGEARDPWIVRADRPVIDQAPSFGEWVRYGMDHIYSGRDHVCFVLALLLVVVLARDPAGWRVRTPLAALRSTAAIVTAFTIAHSITLIAAALGYLALPSRLVESLIAASIVYTAIENVVRPDVRWRFALTFGFGLVHGLGFASVLAERLPPTHVIAPLLGFNLGVELGQLTIVAVALPVWWLIATALGAGRYRRRVLAIAGAPLVVVGIKWLIERIFDVTTLSFWGM
jgi:hypothetical protein